MKDGIGVTNHYGYRGVSTSAEFVVTSMVTLEVVSDPIAKVVAERQHPKTFAGRPRLQRYALVIGTRRSRPNAFRVTRTPSGA